MKPLLFSLMLFISLAVAAQDYDKNWARVIRYETDGQIAKANKETLTILNKAKTDRNETQIIKCFFYQSKYMHTLEEDARQKILDNLERTKTVLSLPSQAILEIIVAQCLESYVNQHRYGFSTRTDTDSIGTFTTWSRKTFDHKIEAAYSRSLNHSELLKKTPLTPYEQIFDFLSVKQFQTQTLYGYILKENIAHLSAKENYEKKDNYIGHEKMLFADTERFTTISFDFVANQTNKVTLSYYQELERHEPSAENRLARIMYVHRLIQDTDLYLQSLQRLQNENPEEITLQNILIEKAQTLSARASIDV